jgi:hypothetical protein
MEAPTRIRPLISWPEAPISWILKLLKLLPLKRGAARAPKLACKGSDAPAHVPTSHVLMTKGIIKWLIRGYILCNIPLYIEGER